MRLAEAITTIRDNLIAEVAVAAKYLLDRGWVIKPMSDLTYTKDGLEVQVSLDPQDITWLVQVYPPYRKQTARNGYLFDAVRMLVEQ